MNEIIQRLDPVLFQKRPQLHIAPYAEVSAVLLLDGSHSRIVSLVPQRPFLRP